MTNSDLEKMLNIFEKYLIHLQYKRNFSGNFRCFTYTFYGKNKDISYEISCHAVNNELYVSIYNPKTEITTDLRFIIYFEIGVDYQDFDKQISTYFSTIDRTI